MRETYDAIVIGDGPAACVFAKAIADAGGRVAMLELPHGIRRDSSDWIDYWLVPLDDAPSWVLSPLGLDCGRIGALASHVLDVAVIGEPGQDRLLTQCALIEVEDLRRSFLAGVESSPRIDRADRFALDRYLYEGNRVVGVQASARRGEPLQLHSALVVDTTRSCARVDVRPTEFGLFDAVVWGRYYGVCRDLGPQGSAAVTIDGRQGARFWLLPISEAETHLGVEVRAQPAGRLISPAQLWEDELVGCHPIAQRLMDARLIEACELQRACYPHGPGVPQAGLLSLEELAAPSPLAFQWSVLQAAADLARDAVSDAGPSRQLTGG